MYELPGGAWSMHATTVDVAGVGAGVAAEGTTGVFDSTGLANAVWLGELAGGL